jgi:hypothetical protein
MGWRGMGALAALGCALLFATGACGGDDDDGTDDDGTDDGTGSDASLPDAGVPDGGVPDGAIDPPDPDAAVDAALPDAGVDAGVDGIAIDGVVTADGFTQVRQGAAAELVITGRELGEVDTVLVGDIDGIVLSASPGEVRVDFFVPHGTAAGPRTVTVSGPGGSASRADALELTFYIVAPTGTADGRGTYQSPISLCDLRDALPALGDTASLLAGDHACDPPSGVPMELPGGMTVAGAGSDVTVVRGAAGSFTGFRVGPEPGGFPSVFRGFTIEAQAAGALILDGRVSLVADDLVIEGPGIVVQTDGFATMTVTGLRQSGPGIGIDGRGRMELTMTGSRFSDCTTGLLVRGGSADVTDTVFERCQLGVRGGFIDGGLSDPFVSVIDSEFVDDMIGVAVGRGFTSVSDSVFTDLEVTTQASQAGARVGFGTLYISGSEISGMDQIGISVEGSGATEGFAHAVVTDVTIIGGPIGIQLGGFPDDETLGVRNSIVRDQTVASVLATADGSFAIIDLGNDGEPGGNQLSVVSGVALLDARPDPFPGDDVIDCTGITLNGRTYSGLVEGPAESLPDYQITGSGILQF